MRNTKSHFTSLLIFLALAGIMLTNGFVERIFAQEKEVDVFQSVDPIANVLDEVLDNYVDEPQLDKVVEGALKGMLNSLDDHSSYIPANVYMRLREDTEGEFEGVGITIQHDEDENIKVMHALPNSPAAKEGILPGDLITKIDGVAIRGMSLDEARDRIRGPHGTTVALTVFRRNEGTEQDPEEIEVKVKRDRIPLVSILEARVLPGGVGYIRVQDFKGTTAEEISRELNTLEEGGMKSLVLDLRWNPGGLLNASKDVSELFLPNNTLVTYTQGRQTGNGNLTENLKLYTERNPLIPVTMPMIILVNEWSASAAEIVTGALQYWSRALIVGEKTYGKGSVQTIIPLLRPEGAALRLTTAHYYTPAEVTIDKRGIIPDVLVPMDMATQKALFRQMVESYSEDMSKVNEQNHGGVSGNTVTGETVEDAQLKRAVEILSEDGVFENLLKKYHKDPKVTQVAAIKSEKEESAEVTP